MAEHDGPTAHVQEHDFTNKIVKIFLDSNLSMILIMLATVVGLAALGLTPREEDPQIVVPLADVYVNFPGHSAAEVEQLVATPLEKILYQIDGVEYVYSMSREGQAIITVRFYVGEDRERSLVKLYKKIDENVDIVPPGVTGWVIKPVEIDDVPVVTLTLSSPQSDGMTLRRVGRRTGAAAGEHQERVAGLRRRRPAPRDAGADGTRPDGRLSRLAARDPAGDSSHERPRAAGNFRSRDRLIRVDVGEQFETPGSWTIWSSACSTAVRCSSRMWPTSRTGRRKSPATSATAGDRHGVSPITKRSPAPRWAHSPHAADEPDEAAAGSAVAECRHDRHRQEKGHQRRLGGRRRARTGRRAQAHVVPDDMEMIVTRNYGLTADEKVNELVEALAVAIVIVVAAAHPRARLARSADRGRGRAGRVRPDAGGQSDAWATRSTASRCLR